MAAGEWDVETKMSKMTDEQLRKMRHLPKVVAHITQIAQQIVDAVGMPNDFGVLVQDEEDTQRPRAFAKPTTVHGIRKEMKDSVLLKSMGGLGA